MGENPGRDCVMTVSRKLRTTLSEQREGIRFCLLFAAFTIVAFGVLYASQNAFIVRVNRHMAWVTEHLLRLVGVNALSSGAVVSMGGFAVDIRNNCNAIYEVGLFAAAVWAYPATWRQRLAGTVIGAAVLYAVNFVRILTLLAVGLLYPEWFAATHVYAWQALFLLVVGTCWIAWISRIRPVA
jgi:exosortase H (IPTLxxWG-CTERM-specific)